MRPTATLDLGICGTYRGCRLRMRRNLRRKTFWPGRRLRSGRLLAEYRRSGVRAWPGEGAGGVGGFRGAPEFCFELGGVLLAHVPLKEHLHSEFARFGAERGHVIYVALSAAEKFC